MQFSNMYVESERHFDITIVGGGMVGVTLAVALAKQKRRVLLIENHLPQPELLKKPPLRVSAINLFSEGYLSELDIFERISQQDKIQFNQLCTWEKGSSKLSFNAEEVNHSHLGYMVRNEALQMAGYESLMALSEECREEYRPKILANVTIQKVIQSDDVVELHCLNHKSQTQHCYASQLLVGADGALSQTRKLVDIGTSGWNYQQHCLSITIKRKFATELTTWQEFQSTGPKAYLPLADDYAALIWYDSKEAILKLQSMESSELKSQILNVFPALTGDFDVIEKASFPLIRRQANQFYKNRVVLVGDAAHSINPLAGQGVNLGFKDVEQLQTCLENLDLTNSNELKSALQKYQFKQKSSSLLMSGAMDAFYQLFSNEKPLLKHFRKSLLSIASKAEMAKKVVLKRALGLF